MYCYTIPGHGQTSIVNYGSCVTRLINVSYVKNDDEKGCVLDEYFMSVTHNPELMNVYYIFILSQKFEIWREVMLTVKRYAKFVIKSTLVILKLCEWSLVPGIMYPLIAMKL